MTQLADILLSQSAAPGIHLAAYIKSTSYYSSCSTEGTRAELTWSTYQIGHHSISSLWTLWTLFVPIRHCIHRDRWCSKETLSLPRGWQQPFL